MKSKSGSGERKEHVRGFYLLVYLHFDLIDS